MAETEQQTTQVVVDEDVRRILAMAAARAGNAEIEAVMGRPLTQRELAEVRRVRAAVKVRAASAKAKGPASSAERSARTRDRHRLVPFAACQDPERRKRLEAEPKAWLRYYLAEAFTRPFRKAHEAIVDGAINAQKTRGRFVVAAERGIGKSTLLWGLVLYFALAGLERFPVCIMWSGSAVSRALRFWRNALAFNDRLLADYPEYCTPYAWARGSGGKLSTAMWAHTHQPTGAMFQLGECMIIFPDNRGAIGCETINGNPRGLNHPCSDGSILRPTLVLIDEPQSRGVARSPVQVMQTIEVIDGDVAGLGDAAKTLAMLMSGNCIYPGDVMDHYLNNDEWQSVRIPRIMEWPVGFWDVMSDSRKTWEEWNKLRVAGIRIRDGGRAARMFYAQHKEVMIVGIVVSNEDGFERSKGQPDALYGAMESYYSMGHAAFMAERQQKPEAAASTTYDLQVETILKRKSGFRRLQAPAGSIITMGVDINYVGFNWTVIASDPLSQARRIVAHGIWPRTGELISRGATDAAACLLIRRGMSLFNSEVIQPMRINCVGDQKRIGSVAWDASNGKWQDAIVAAIRTMESPIQQHPLKAFGSRNYRPKLSDIKQGKGWHIAQFARIGNVLVVNADYWREMMQRGFVVEPTEAGALSLYETETAEHKELALQICGERLLEKIVTERGEYYEWSKSPGIPNDRSDSTVYACALSGYEGIGEEKTQRRRRKVYSQADLRGRR